MPRRRLDDADLLAALKRRERFAVRALHDRVRPVISRAILRILGSRDQDHDELVQVALIQVLESMARFRGECSLDTWASRVTAYAVYNELTKRQTAQKLWSVRPVDEDAEGPSSDNPESRVTDSNTIARIRRHLDALEPDRAWTLLLHDVCGYELREIAQITKVTVAAAQARLVRGRRELQKRIEADPELSGFLRGREGIR